MDGPLNDSSLDREIESLLAAEPSPEFVARVRTRVAQERSPGIWRVSWMFAMAGAVAAVIVTVIAWPSPQSTSSKTPIQTRQVPEAVAAITTSPESAVREPVRKRPALVGVPVRIAAPDRRIDINLPDVVIADNEVKTFSSLVASIRHSQFDVAVPVAPDLDTPIEIKELPPVEALEIEPIVRVAVLQAEGERP